MMNQAQVQIGSHKTLSIHIQLRGLMMSKLQGMRKPPKFFIRGFCNKQYLGLGGCALAVVNPWS